MQWRYLIKAIQAAFAGHAGDTAAYKAAALATSAFGNLDQQLTTLKKPLPDISLTDLRSHPSDSFGYALAEFLEANHIKPLTLSPTAKEELKHVPPLVIRYPILHDAFHVLLEFDTSLAGELGVWSFVAAQNYCAAFNRAAWIGKWIARLLIPWQWKRLHTYERRGNQLGNVAICVITEPLEELFSHRVC